MRVAGGIVLVAGLLLTPLQGAGQAPPSLPSDTTPPLERALELLGGEDPLEARAPLLEAVPQESGLRRTALLHLVSVLDRVEGPARGHVARAFLLSEEGAPEEAHEALMGSLDEVRDEDRVAVLALAAFVADGFDPARAEEHRSWIVEERPEALEAPEAALLLARYRAPRMSLLEETAEHVAEVLTQRPDHPMAPELRRELERIQRLLQDSGGGR